MTSIVEYRGPVNIRNVMAFRDFLIAACDEEKDMLLDIAEVDETDLSFVQILCALRRYLSEKGFVLRLASPAPAHVVTLLGRAGFLSDPSADDIEFWFHGELPQ